MPNTCPTCGSKVTVHHGEEGTSSYVPATTDRELREAAQVVVKAEENVSAACTARRNITNAKLDRQDAIAAVRTALESTDTERTPLDPPLKADIEEASRLLKAGDTEGLAAFAARNSTARAKEAAERIRTRHPAIQRIHAILDSDADLAKLPAVCDGIRAELRSLSPPMPLSTSDTDPNDRLIDSKDHSLSASDRGAIEAAIQWVNGDLCAITEDAEEVKQAEAILGPRILSRYHDSPGVPSDAIPNLRSTL